MSYAVHVPYIELRQTNVDDVMIDFPPRASPAGGEYFVFRDAIHNLIEIDDEVEGRYLRDILRTRELQRLRRLRQNGLCALVYPTLEGTRFPHALGAYHIARKIIRHLKVKEPSIYEGFPDFLRIEDRDVAAFSFAALLHDIGHGPFSHLWEEIYNVNHEKKCFDILSDNSSRLHKLLTSPGRINAEYRRYDGILDEILKFLRNDHPLHFLMPLLSGHLDVDRLDFMARDTRAAGVTYGFHDLEWIIRSLRFARIPALVQSDGSVNPSGWVVAVDGRKGLNTLIQFLRARENMYNLVYHHKTTRAAQCLLKAILHRAQELHKSGKAIEFSTYGLRQWISGARSHGALLKIEDDDILSSVKNWADKCEDNVLQKLCTKFLERDLFKVVEVTSDVASLLKEIDHPDHGEHLRTKLKDIFVEIDQEELPSCEKYWYEHDTTHFDMIGDPSRDDRKPVWIIQFGRFGLEYTPIRRFWEEKFGDRTLCAERHYIHCYNSQVANAVRSYVDRLPSFRAEAADSTAAIVGNYKPVRLISRSGAHKEVYLGISTQPGQTDRNLVAIKYYKNKANIDLDLIVPNRKLGEAESRNITLSQGFRHPDDDSQYVLVESCWHASLEDLVKRDGLRRDLFEIFDIGRQLFSGLAVMHERRLRHTDIKLDNCGYNFNLMEKMYKIGDFGCLSQKPDELPASSTLEGTKRTIAPERMGANPKIGLASDVWALGVTLFAACTGRYWFLPVSIPHQGEGRDSGAKTLLRQREEEVLKDLSGAVHRFRREVDLELPSYLGDVLSRCFGEFAERGTAAVIAEEFDNKLKEMEDLPEADQTKVRCLWRQFEDRRGTSTKQFEGFEIYVPKTLIER